MGFFSSYWTVPGVSPDARDAALRAASAEGVEVGAWLSEVIHRVNAEEVSITRVEGRAADSVQAKLTSIERAMLRPDAGGFAGSLGRA